MKLYYAETLMPRKACAVARHLGSPVEFVRVDLGRGEHKKPGYLAINPAGRVPALVDGDYRLSESNAVMAYLALRAGSDLWPADARQVEVIRWLSWDSEHFTRHGDRSISSMSSGRCSTWARRMRRGSGSDQQLPAKRRYPGSPSGRARLAGRGWAYHRGFRRRDSLALCRGQPDSARCVSRHRPLA